MILILRKVGAAAGDPGWEVGDVPRDVGRTPPADIPLLDPSVSRHHARVRPSAGEFVVEDLNSKNGTYINDRQVLRSSTIGNGDRIAFGDVVLLAEIRGTVLEGDKAPSPGATVLYPDAATPPLPRERTPVPRAVDATVLERDQRTPAVPQPSAAADGLLPALRRVEQDLAEALTQFEHHGGRETLLATLDRVGRLQGRPTGHELETLSNWLPTVRALLEIELRLIDALSGTGSGSGSGSGSAASGLRPRDQLQSHTGNVERVSRS